MIAVTLTGDRGVAYVAREHIAAVTPNETTHSTCLLLSGGHELYIRESVEHMRALVGPAESVGGPENRGRSETTIAA